MNIKLIFPPQWSPYQPYLSLPSLSAHLKNKGYNVNQCDLNIESYNIFLSREYLIKIYERILNRRTYLESRDILPPRYQKEYCEIVQATLFGLDVIDRIDKAKSLLRDSESFYNLELYADAIETIEKGLKMVSTAYYPTRISLYEFEMNSYLLAEADISKALMDEQKNPYILLYKDYFVDKILKESPDLVGISIIGTDQIIPGLTLARLIKLQRPDMHIVLGGSIFTRLLDVIKEWSEIFGNIFDSIILYEGEIPLLELCQCLSNGQGLETVSNLVYKKNGSTVITELCKPERIDLLPTPCFDELPLNLYFSPHPVLPILSSRGCYWGKCAFCDHGEIYGDKYRQRRIDLLMEDIRNLSNKYSTEFFTFNDEAIAPSRLWNISEAIISRGLKVKCLTDIRLESQFTNDHFRLAFRAGFLSLYYGLESGNDRVLAHMFKGTDCQTAKTVFKNSSDAGIWNHAFLFFGFPTETEAEARQTMDFIFTNKDIIHSVGHSEFALNRCSKVMKNPEMFGVKSIYEDKHAVLGLYSSYSVSTGLTQRQAEDIADEFYELIKEGYNDFGNWGTLPREHLLLYLAHYGRDRLHLIKDMLPLIKKKCHLDAFQVGLDTQMHENLVPHLKSEILCGLARFDVSKILSEKNKNRETLYPGKFIILWDLNTNKIISITPSGGDILARCDGKHTLTEIASEVAEIYNMTPDQVITDCRKFIESMIKMGMCNLNVNRPSGVNL